MKQLNRIVFLATVMFWAASISFAAPIDLIANGGFETGDLSGWDYKANVVVQSNNVHSGNFAAGLSVSNVGSFWGFKYDTNLYSAILIQELTGYENTDRMFDASFAYDVDVLKNYIGNDKLYVGYLSVAGDDWSNVSLYGAAALVASGDTGGWQTFSSMVNLNGQQIDHLYLGFYFADGTLTGGSPDYSSAFLDDISVKAETAPVPEPATLLLLGSGLLGLAGFRRKNK